MKLHLDYLSFFPLLWWKDAMQYTNQITNCSIKLSDVFVCNFADFLTRFKNGLSAYYSSCSLDVRCRLCSKLCVLLSKMSIQKILIQLCGEIILIYSNWQQNNYVPTTMFRPTVKNMANIKFTLFFRKLILCSIIIICFEKLSFGK